VPAALSSATRVCSLSLGWSGFAPAAGSLRVLVFAVFVARFAAAVRSRLLAAARLVAMSKPQ
jgi:hypothetical protein